MVFRMIAGGSFLLMAFLGTSAMAEDVLSLDGCPDKPNCVSSFATTEKHKVEPIRYDGTREAAMKQLLDYMENTEGWAVVGFEKYNLRAIKRSRVFGFVDDVEFLFDHSEPVIHVRSASRIGHFDFGANRKRVETLRAVFAE